MSAGVGILVRNVFLGTISGLGAGFFGAGFFGAGFLGFAAALSFAIAIIASVAFFEEDLAWATSQTRLNILPIRP
jgi:hypothetical protein